jgi:hypothetical protein
MPTNTPMVYLGIMNSDAEDEYQYDEEDNAAVERYCRQRLLSFEFSDHVDKIDEAQLSFQNDDRGMTDGGAFTVGMKLYVTWGWPGELAMLRQMIVVKREQNNPFVVWLRDPTVLMTQKQGGRKAQDSDSGFVRKVLAEYGYRGATARITETTARHAITQPGKRTDAGQIWLLAKRNGFEFYIDALGAYWGPRAVGEDPARIYVFRSGLGAGRILGEPEITQFTDRAYSIVTVKGRDPDRKKNYTIEISSKDFEWDSLGAEIEIADPKDGEAPSKRQSRAEKHEVRSVGYMTEEDARQLARAIYRDNAQGVYQMNLKVVGDARLGAKTLIQLAAHSIAYDGLYYVREAKHSITGGTYELALECERDALASINAGKKVRRKATNNKVDVTRLPDSDIAMDGEAPLDAKIFVQYDDTGGGRPAWLFTDEPGCEATKLATEEEIYALGDKTLRSLADQGAYTPLPD